MKIEMQMPQMGESVSEATVAKWLKRVGDKVEKDETILEISTDKVDSEIPAPESGVLSEIKVEEGETVEVKTVIAIIETDASKAKSAPKSKPAPEPTPKKAPEERASAGSSITPLAKNLAVKHGISDKELSQIKPSGAQGKLHKKDVLDYVAAKSTPAKPSPLASSDQIVPMDRMRQKIAEHMIRSKQTSAHTYTVAEVDFSRVVTWRKKNQPAFVSRHGIKLNYTPFFLEAAAKALVQFPDVNASVDGTNIILKQRINLGCAVALGTKGLVVPVITDADQRSLAGLALALHDLAERARTRQLAPDDTQGGTFTVTNPGTFGSVIGYPIINQPQLAILGVGAIKQRPVVVDGMIAIREICFLTLSYDHRAIDGALAGQFLQFITRYLTDWDLDRELY